MTAAPPAARALTPSRVREVGPAGWEPRRRRFAWVFAGVWLFYLLEPLRDAWTSHTAALPWRVLAVVALLLFAVGFLAFFVWWRSRRTVGSPQAPAVAWIALAAGAALLVLAAPGAGESTVA